MSHSTSSPEPSRSPNRPASVRRRGRLTLVSAALLTACGLCLWVWWDERPLGNIERELQQGRDSHALALADDFLRSHPRHGAAEELKARALVGLRKWPEATRLFEQIGAVTPAAERSWSRALLHLQRWSDALPLLIHLHTLTPDDADVLHELAACHAKLGNVDDAVRLAEALTKLPGRAAQGDLMLGTLHNNRQNYKLAIQAWRRVLQHDPSAKHLQIPADEFLLAIGRACLRDGQPRGAIPMLERSLAVRVTAAARAALGDAREQTGDTERARELWRQAVAAEPNHVAARLGLARAALEVQRANEALEWLEPLVDQRGLDSSAAYLLQRTFTVLGESQKVETWKAQVAELRRQEQRQAMIDAGLQRAPHSFWSQAVRAHLFAAEGNLAQAGRLLAPLVHEAPQEPFVQQLARALQTGTPLPSLDLIPMKQF